MTTIVVDSLYISSRKTGARSEHISFVMGLPARKKRKKKKGRPDCINLFLSRGDFVVGPVYVFAVIIAERAQFSIPKHPR